MRIIGAESVQVKLEFVQPRTQVHITTVKNPVYGWSRAKLSKLFCREGEYWEQLCLSFLQNAYIKPGHEADSKDKTSRLFNFFSQKKTESFFGTPDGL